MKKVILLLLCACLIVSCAACGGNDDAGNSSSEVSSGTESPKHSIDVMTYAGNGVVPELDVALGTYIGTVKEIYNYKDPSTAANDESGFPTEQDAESYYNSVQEFDMTIYDSYTEVKVDVGEAYYFYKTKYEGSGISKIVCLKDCYGFRMGITLRDDLKSAMDAEPVSEEEDIAVDFLPGKPTGFQRVTYETGNCTLEFYFDNDFLSCVVLTDNRYWVEE